MTRKFDHVGSAHVFKQRRESKAWIGIGIAAAIFVLLIIA